MSLDYSFIMYELGIVDKGLRFADICASFVICGLRRCSKEW
jgi:hypothetical protein